MWKNIVKPCRTQMTIWHMRIACWIPKATNTHTHTHTQYVLRVTFPLKQWLQDAPQCYIVRILPVFCLLTSSNRYFGYVNTKLPQFYHASYPNDWSTIGTSGNLFLEALSASRFCRIYVRPSSVRLSLFISDSLQMPWLTQVCYCTSILK